MQPHIEVPHTDLKCRRRNIPACLYINVRKMDIKELQKRVIEFRDQRDWGQYHNPKDLALSICLEAAELLEIFQWKDAAQVERIKNR